MIELSDFYFFGLVKTSVTDLPLFEEIGIEPFVIGDKKEYKLGTAEIAGGTVEISVICMPATFWKFKINSLEGGEFLMSTGSGTLSDYWPTVKLFAGSMIVVE